MRLEHVGEVPGQPEGGQPSNQRDHFPYKPPIDPGPAGKRHQCDDYVIGPIHTSDCLMGRARRERCEFYQYLTMGTRCTGLKARY